MHSNMNYGEGDATHGSPHARSSPMRRRNPMACLFCRRRKIKCEFINGQEVCDHCRSKNIKCTVLSVAEEEALKAWDYTDEALMSMPNTDLEELLRRLLPQQHSTIEHTEPHLTARIHHRYGPPSSSNHTSPSTGQDRNETLYRTYAHNHHTASQISPTNPATMPINTPHSQPHAHLQPCIYPSFPNYTGPSPNHQTSYQNSAPGGASTPHGDHQLQQLLSNIPAHSNAGQSQDHANGSGQLDYPFQVAQQPSQGQISQYQYSGYPSTMAPGYIHDGWRR